MLDSAAGRPGNASNFHSEELQEKTVETLHGRTVNDSYRWLENLDHADSQQWLERQHALFDRHACSWSHRETFRDLMTDLLGFGFAAAPVSSSPVWRAERRFFLHRTPGEQLPRLMVGDAEGGSAADAETLLNPLNLDSSAATTVDAWHPSWTGNLLAYQVSERGSERPQLCVLDVSERRALEGTLTPGRKTPVAWLPDDTGFYYVTGSDPTAHRTTGQRQVCLHRIGESPEHDTVVFGTESPHLSTKTSADGRWLMVSTSPGATSGNALWLARLYPDALDTPHPTLLHDGTSDGTRAVLKFAPGGRIYAVTDADAPFGKLCSVDPAEPTSAAWRTLIAEEPPAVFSGFVTLRDADTGNTRLLVNRARHGIGELTLHDDARLVLGSVPTPGAGTITRLSASPDGGAAWFSYTDFLTPPTVYRFRLNGPSRAPEIADRVPERPQGEQATTRQLSYTSGDGVRVRMHLIGVPGESNGPRPTILTAYGGFGASSPPGYSPTILSWVRAGGLYAIANVRGGGEEGTDWHAAGRGRNKPNAIADFTAAAQWLVEQGWTSPDQLAIKGASHSGFLVAAAVTQRPALYAAAVCSDSVTDMVRYQHFGLGQLWTEEFGTSDDPAQLDTLLSYSPYHQVRDGVDYPAVLLTCAKTDPRVDALHTRKMTAALQHANGGTSPVLLRCEDGVGHGVRSASRWAGLQTDILAFCAKHTGM